jgi:hypothetical protein
MCFFFFMHLLTKEVRLLQKVAIVDLCAWGQEDYLWLNRASVVVSSLEVPHKPIFHTVDCCLDRATFLRHFETAHARHACFF